MEAHQLIHAQSCVARAGNPHAVATAIFPAKEYPEFSPDFYAVTFCDADNNVIEFGHSSPPAGSTPA